MMRINVLSVDINKKIDIIVCNQQMDNMNGSIRETLSTVTKQMERNQGKHNDDNAQLRAEFEHFKSKDFSEIVVRVTVLEKKLSQLTTQVNNLKIEAPSSGGVSEERF